MRWVFLATDNIASLTNAHHGRPVFFNLQTNIAATVGWSVSFPGSLLRHRQMIPAAAAPSHK